MRAGSTDDGREGRVLVLDLARRRSRRRPSSRRRAAARAVRRPCRVAGLLGPLHGGRPHADVGRQRIHPDQPPVNRRPRQRASGCTCETIRLAPTSAADEIPRHAIATPRCRRAHRLCSSSGSDPVRNPVRPAARRPIPGMSPGSLRAVERAVERRSAGPSGTLASLRTRKRLPPAVSHLFAVRRLDRAARLHADGDDAHAHALDGGRGIPPPRSAPSPRTGPSPCPCRRPTSIADLPYVPRQRRPERRHAGRAGEAVDARFDRLDARLGRVAMRTPRRGTTAATG